MSPDDLVDALLIEALTAQTPTEPLPDLDLIDRARNMARARCCRAVRAGDQDRAHTYAQADEILTGQYRRMFIEADPSVVTS